MLNCFIAKQEKIVVNRLASLLNHEGHKVIATAANGREALLLIQRLSPDLLVLDCRLPQLDSLDLLRRLKNSLSTVPKWIIFYTCNPEANAAREAFSLGVTGYLDVESDEVEFLQCLKLILRGQRFLSPSIETIFWQKGQVLPPDEPDGFALTERETDILHWIGSGMGNPEIACQLFISVETVKCHRRSIKRKFGLTGGKSSLLPLAIRFYMSRMGDSNFS